MTVGSILAEGRAAANALMTEVVRIGQYTDSTDEETGNAVRSLVSVVYEGPGRVKYTANATRNSDSASQLLTTQDIVLSIPTGSPVVDEGNAVEVVSSAVDEGLAGRWFTVDGVAEMGQTTSHRYPVTELS